MWGIAHPRGVACNTLGCFMLQRPGYRIYSINHPERLFEDGRLFEFEFEWDGGGVGVGSYLRLDVY